MMLRFKRQKKNCRPRKKKIKRKSRNLRKIYRLKKKKIKHRSRNFRKICRLKKKIVKQRKRSSNNNIKRRFMGLSKNAMMLN